jgi:hypothetical protein
MAYLHLRLPTADTPGPGCRRGWLNDPRHLSLRRLHRRLHRNGFFFGSDILQHRRNRNSGFWGTSHSVSFFRIAPAEGPRETGLSPFTGFAEKSFGFHIKLTG